MQEIIQMKNIRLIVNKSWRIFPSVYSGIATHIVFLTVAITGASCVDIQPTISRAECEARMKRAYQVIRKHVQENMDIPRDKHGHPSFFPLYCDSQLTHTYCIAKSDSCCTISTNDNDHYVLPVEFNPEAVSKINDPTDVDDPVVIFCHLPSQLHSKKSNIALLMLSNGAVQMMEVDRTAYEKWVIYEFLPGNLTVPSCLKNKASQIE